jgi:hypothetical protein
LVKSCFSELRGVLSQALRGFHLFVATRDNQLRRLDQPPGDEGENQGSDARRDPGQ